MRPASGPTDDKPGSGKRFPTSTRTRPGKPDRSLSRRTRSVSPSLSAASLAGDDLLTDELSLFENLQISTRPDPNPRIFPYSVKQQCWDKAEKIKARDPDRWRRDPLGNVLFRKLGGKSTLENCQVLQATVNRSKGNRTELSKNELIQKSAYCRVSGRDMDLLELSAYGNVRRGQDSGGCKIQ